MIFLFCLVIGFWSSSTVLGYQFKKDCGNDTSVIKIIHNRNNIIDNYSAGYVIYPRAVLTVAHRVKDFSPEDFQITSFLKPLDDLVRNISKIYIHPKYNSCNGSHDFAILTFEDPLPANYTPICLPSENFMDYLQVNYDCLPWDYYYSRFYKSSNESESECPMILSNFDPREDIEDSKECLSKGETTDIIGDRFTVVYICKLFLEDENDYRQYYNMHKYYGRLCEKNQNDTYISYDGEDFIYDVYPWINYIISILIEEDDQPLKLSFII